MAKKATKAKKVEKDDLLEGWELHEEAVEEEKKQKDNSDSRLGNIVLWALFIGVFLAIVILPYLASGPSKNLESTYVNGIKISAQNDPITAVKNLHDLHIDGKQLDQSNDAHDALNEIFVVFGQSTGSSQAGRYTLYAGLSDTTGITIDSNIIRVEGKDRPDFWTAVWTFNSIISDTTINSTVDFFDVQNLLIGRKEVYLLQNMDKVCSPYGQVISAEDDLLSSLGFKQAQLGFDLKHYELTSDGCKLFENESQTVACPVADKNTFVITMEKSDSNENRFDISDNEIVFYYANCETVNRVSAILGDMLYPNIISSIAGVQFPTSA